MRNLLESIRRCEDHWRELFAQKRSFNSAMVRWHNPKLTDQYTTNAFCSKTALSRQDVAQAYAYQQEQGLHFLQFMCRQPMDKSTAEAFGLKENLVLTMALLQGDPDDWKQNPDVIIRDIQEEDIAGEIIAFHLEQEMDALLESDYALRQIYQDMDAAKEHPEYHWLAAYKDGKVVAICHALCHSGCVELDDLVVAPDARKQYIATTLFAYAVQKFRGLAYLHADEDDTPKELYQRLGFVTVDRCWEYRRLW